MKENREKDLNQFLEKVMGDLELEQAPMYFSNSVLSKIEAFENKSSITVYTPLISKPVWAIIVVFVVTLCGILGFGIGFSGQGLLSTFQFNTVGNLNILEILLAELNISTSTVYGFIGLTVFALIQVAYLKRFFAKRSVVL